MALVKALRINVTFRRLDMSSRFFIPAKCFGRAPADMTPHDRPAAGTEDVSSCDTVYRGMHILRSKRPACDEGRAPGAILDSRGRDNRLRRRGGHARDSLPFCNQDSLPRVIL